MPDLFGGDTDESGSLKNFGDDTTNNGTGLDFTGVGDDAGSNTNQTFYENNGSSSDTSGNVVDRSYTGGGGGGFDFSKLSLKDVNDYLKGNMGLASLLGGAGLAALGAGTPKTTPTIYQGGIPNLVATRNMITAPPTGRRAGAGGVNYGGDVTYSLAPAGQKPWANLRGDSAFITDPQGQANVLKGTGGADTQSMANKIGYNLPGGWDGFSPQQKIAWFNQNNVSYDQLLAAGVPQSDIDYMWSNGYTSGRPANWGKTTTTGGNTTVTGGADTVTGGNGIDALAKAQTVAQNQADKINLKLPSDWSTYDAAKKIAWYNSNNITPEQLLAAGVDQATIDWMKQNGYGKSSVTTNTVTSNTGSDSITGGTGSDSITGGSGIDALVAAQNKAQTQADKIGLNLPSDWSTYDAAKKIDWFNRNGITSKQLLDAGVDQGDINWMQQHGFATESTQPVTSNDTGTGGINTNSAVGGGSTSGQKGNIPPASEWNSYTPAQKIDFFNRTNTSPADLRAKGVDDDTINWMMQNGYNPKVSTPEEIAPSSAKTQQSAGLMSAINQGMTQDQYIGNIKDWLNKNSTASDAEVYKQMKEYGIGAEDVASALGVPVSTIQGKINALTQQGDISPAPFIQPDSNLPPKVADQSGGIKDIMDREMSNSTRNTVGFREEDTPSPGSEGYQLDNQSAGLQSAIKQGMSEDQYIGNIKNWLTQNSTASDAEVFQQMQEYGIGADDVARALGVPVSVIQSKIDALGVNNYASGGMAKGRYLQGQTDGMADEIPAQIGRDQPAALSHGEFVVPADVVSHLGNGNSDAGAKKLYQMMDRIRMARTGNKEQGKKINPDKFMPGGLAKAYASGGSVMNFATGGTTTLPANVTGTQAGFSNWAGDYATNLLGQGQALANMPFQQYMGPLTAGPSALQNKVTQGLESLSFPGVLGQSFTSAGAPAIGEGGQPVGGGGIAASYMNPYLKNVLEPQLAELSRQSQINLQPSLAKLTQAGGFGGGRQAIMESEANRNLLNAQNTAIGTGYANAYDKAMQQFNTEQGQAKTLADMMASQGATNRAIEAEGVAADKAQFEEARANPFKMVQFQQSLLSGMPINAMDYTMQAPSTMQKVAQGVSTVDELLKVLYGVAPAKKV